MRLLAVILLVLLLVPGWAGLDRLPLLGPRAEVMAQPVAFDSSGSRTRDGALTWLGGVALTSPDPAFGGFSAMSVSGRRFTLLSDGGNIVSFDMGADWRVRAPAFAVLPAGPGTGWIKEDRDSESMARDPVSGTLWVGFERANQIWRYAPGFARAERRARPPAMRRWARNGGAESLVRLPDGGFVVLSEAAGARGGGYKAWRFAGDPTVSTAGFLFTYLPPAGFKASDAALLPDGRLLVLNRRFAVPFSFSAKLTVIDPAAVRPGARIAGREVATLAAPLIHDNFEALAVTREGGATIVWIASDDNGSFFQRTLLLKFRFAG